MEREGRNPHEPQIVLKILTNKCEGCGASPGVDYIQRDCNAFCVNCGSKFAVEHMFTYFPDEGRLEPGKGMARKAEMKSSESQAPAGWWITEFLPFGELQVPVFLNQKNGLVYPGRSLAWINSLSQKEKIVLEDQQELQTLSAATQVTLHGERGYYDSNAFTFNLGYPLFEQVHLNVDGAETAISVKPGIIGDLRSASSYHKPVRFNLIDSGDMVMVNETQESRNTLIVTGSWSLSDRRLNLYANVEKPGNSVLMLSPGAVMELAYVDLGTVIVAPGARFIATSGRVKKLVYVQPGYGGETAYAVVPVAEKIIEKPMGWYNDNVTKEMAAIFGLTHHQDDDLDI